MKNQLEKFDIISRNMINGNISDAKVAIKSLSKVTLIDFLKYLQICKYENSMNEVQKYLLMQNLPVGRRKKNTERVKKMNKIIS